MTPTQTNRYAGIVTFRHREVETTALWRRLSERGVVCAQRGGGIRLSPHFYNKKEELEHVVNLINEFIIGN